MTLLTVLGIGIAAWSSIVVIVLGMCRAAAHADRQANSSIKALELDLALTEPPADTRPPAPLPRSATAGWIG